MLDLLRPPLPRDGVRFDAGTPRDQVLLRSHLIGTDVALTRAGGGNFSAKGTLDGEPTLWMSSWGCDGASTTEEDFPALRLATLRELRHVPPLESRTMLDRVAAAAMRPQQKPPGIETLTHAFIPATHVDHCHPDAVIALTCIPDGRKRAAAHFGEEAIWFDYRQFDMGVAQELADRIEAQPGCRFVLLANHGIFTWAETSERCYRNSLEAVRRATHALHAARTPRTRTLGGPAVTAMAPERAADLLTELLPVIRGALRDGDNPIVVRAETGPGALRFASSRRGPRLSQYGPGCPDSLVTVGYRPLALTPQELTPTGVRAAVDRYRARYADLFDRHADPQARRQGPRRDLPRVLLLPGIGEVVSGADATQARICAEHFAQTRSVIEAADAAGGYSSLHEAQGIADEYWPLMRAKPLLHATTGPLGDAVVLVAATGDGTVTAHVAEDLTAAGAHVMVPGTAPERLPGTARTDRLAVLTTPATRPAHLVAEAVHTFGGFDVVVDMTDDDRLIRAAAPVFARQRGRGVVCLAGRGTAGPPAARPSEVGPSDGGGHIEVIAEHDPTLIAERIVATRRHEVPLTAGSKEAAS
ncbi:class II aldolase/adducin family protein [Plantactinospora sp. WMMC1484]|uniref:class II aldolase/adducin family protein n=1 Tax=Plantactinospora sp. WMMC1484 TaxID=3404122 RepID=UPI003BF5D578